jgi:hypothetical protein
LKDKKQIIGHKYHKEEALQQLNDVITAISVYECKTENQDMFNVDDLVDYDNVLEFPAFILD